MKKEKNNKAYERLVGVYKSYCSSLCNKSFSIGNGYVFLLSPNIGKIVTERKEIIPLEKNMLVFLGPQESFSVHTDTEEKETPLLLWVDALIVNSFFDYLEVFDEKSGKGILNMFLPSRCILSTNDWAYCEEMFHFFEKNELKEGSALDLRLFLPSLFSFLYNKTKLRTINPTPFWLENVCRKMEKKENFVEGISRMVQLSGRTREHLSRSMKKYKSVTLSAYINDLRLSYAANMLVNSDMHIVDLCYESGFSSLDYFGKQFKEKYGMAPSKFRIIMRKRKIGI